MTNQPQQDYTRLRFKGYDSSLAALMLSTTGEVLLFEERPRESVLGGIIGSYFGPVPRIVSVPRETFEADFDGLQERIKRLEIEGRGSYCLPELSEVNELQRQYRAMQEIKAQLRGI